MRRKGTPPYTRAPRPGTWEFYCDHANEVPIYCPCSPGCGCRFYHCKTTRSRGPEKEPTTPRDAEHVPCNSGGVTSTGRAAAAHRPSHHERPCIAGRGRSEPSRRRKVSSSRVVPPTVGAGGAGRAEIERAFKDGWRQGYYDGGEHDCRMFLPTAESAWEHYQFSSWADIS